MHIYTCVHVHLCAFMRVSVTKYGVNNKTQTNAKHFRPYVAATQSRRKQNTLGQNAFIVSPLHAGISD